MANRKAIVLLSIAWSAALGMAQPSEITAPQVAAGPGFRTSLTLLNQHLLGCEVDLVYHVGAGQDPEVTILTDGEARGNRVPLSLGGGRSRRVTLTTEAGFFVGAATAEVAANCSGLVTLGVEYQIAEQTGAGAAQDPPDFADKVGDVFSYQTRPNEWVLSLAQCMFGQYRSVVELLPDGERSTRSAIALVSTTPLAATLSVVVGGAQAALALTGQHNALFVDELDFGEGGPPTGQSEMEVCLDISRSPGLVSGSRYHVLFLQQVIETSPDGLSSQLAVNPVAPLPLHCGSTNRTLCDVNRELGVSVNATLLTAKGLGTGSAFPNELRGLKRLGGLQLDGGEVLWIEVFRAPNGQTILQAFAATSEVPMFEGLAVRFEIDGETFLLPLEDPNVSGDVASFSLAIDPES